VGDAVDATRAAAGPPLRPAAPSRGRSGRRSPPAASSPTPGTSPWPARRLFGPRRPSRPSSRSRPESGPCRHSRYAAYHSACTSAPSRSPPPPPRSGAAAGGCSTERHTGSVRAAAGPPTPARRETRSAGRPEPGTTRGSQTTARMPLSGHRLPPPQQAHKACTAREASILSGKERRSPRAREEAPGVARPRARAQPVQTAADRRGQWEQLPRRGRDRGTPGPFGTAGTSTH
jgi:hypothetical protein